MKKLNLKTNLCALMLPLALLSGNAMAGNTSADVTITALVTPVCYISASTASVDLGQIPSSAFSGVSAGTLLTGSYNNTVNLTPECYGASGATITLAANNSNIASSGCLQSTPAENGGNPMQFCVHDGSNTSSRIDLNTSAEIVLGVAELTADRTLTIAAAGNGNVAATGEHEAYLTATIAAE